MPTRSRPSLAVSIVTHAPDMALLRQEMRSLVAAIRRANADGCLGETTLYLVDNGPGDKWTLPLKEMIDQEIAAPLDARLLAGHGNVGYGQGHNLAIARSSADYHLIVNPDVILAEDALSEGLRYLESHGDAALVAPQVRDAQGAIQFLCKRYPSVLDLVLRGFAPGPIRNMFRERLERYEMRDLLKNEPVASIQIASGSFMLCRRAALHAVGGFSDAYFLYFEDFDLSLRLGRTARLAYVPGVRIIHHGGYAGGKGPVHWLMFLRSAMIFFRRHGWKWR